MTKANKIDPEQSDAYFNRGWFYYFLKKYQEALRDFTRAIELPPNNTYYYCGRGNVYIVTGNKAKAIQDYKQALKLDPKNQTAREELEEAG